MQDSVIHDLIQFEKRSWAMKVYAAPRWGNQTPCPLRFVVNPYLGCSHKCQYCYVPDHVQVRQGFRKSLLHDIKRAKAFGLKPYVVEVSASTDPFQPIEKKYGDSLFAITELLNAGFPVVVVTKNPGMLLEPSYIELAHNSQLSVDVTIASLHEGEPDSIFTGIAPSAKDKIQAIRRLTQINQNIRVKIDPLIPSVNGIIGQSEAELWELVRTLSEAGVRLVISKTLRLNDEVSANLYNNLIDFYKTYGIIEGINWCLSKPLQRKLLAPLFEACKYYKMPFCSCCDVGIFPSNEIVSCLVPGEDEAPIMEHRSSFQED